MSNVDTLVANGLILSSNMPSQADQDTINNTLTADEISALIKVYNTVGASFLQRNCNVSSPGPSAQRIVGIVF